MRFFLVAPMLAATTYCRTIPTDAGKPPVDLFMTGSVPSDQYIRAPEPVQHLHDTKYFHEPPGSYENSHYDIRFFPGEPVDEETRKDSLRHLIRSYLQTFRSLGVETWLAHGTLLGWWWNGRFMPWDTDLDTQVSGTTLLWLGANLNMTTHNYTYTDDAGEVKTREYLLDVNTFVSERVRGDGNNVIDARWIDKRNGLFIDITGLSETEPVTMPGIWNCKNYHRYSTRDLYPLRETIFEDTPALVPYNFDKILTKEYSQKAMMATVYEG